MTELCHLAKKFAGIELPLKVCESNAGFYLGCYNERGPVSRESEELFGTREKAAMALATGDWTQRAHP